MYSHIYHSVTKSLHVDVSQLWLFMGSSSIAVANSTFHYSLLATVIVTATYHGGREAAMAVQIYRMPHTHFSLFQSVL